MMIFYSKLKFLVALQLKMIPDWGGFEQELMSNEQELMS
jgi:hypothetical protein